MRPGRLRYGSIFVADSDSRLSAFGMGWEGLARLGFAEAVFTTPLGLAGGEEGEEGYHACMNG